MLSGGRVCVTLPGSLQMGWCRLDLSPITSVTAERGGCGAVKKCNAAAVSAWRIRRDDVVASRPAGVDAICEFRLLEDAQVHIGLGHPPECRLQPPLSAVTDVIGAESNRHRPIRRLPGRVTHTLPPDPKFFSLPRAPASLPRCRSRLPSSLALPHRYPCRYRSRPLPY